MTNLAISTAALYSSWTIFHFSSVNEPSWLSVRDSSLPDFGSVYKPGVSRELTSYDFEADAERGFQSKGSALARLMPSATRKKAGPMFNILRLTRDNDMKEKLT